MALDQGGTAAQVGSGAAPNVRALIVSIAWDIVLTTSIPLACYWVAKRFFAATELRALLVATIFPLFQSAAGLARRRELDPIASIVLLGIVTSVLALTLGGDPRLLLIRESFFTAAFGVACLLSLAVFPRPIMFYFGRYLMAERDPVRRSHFDASWNDPVVRRGHRLVTLVWGLVYVAEFVVRVAMVYRLPSATVLALSPVVMGGATIVTVIWTFRYAGRLRERSAPTGGARSGRANDARA